MADRERRLRWLREAIERFAGSIDAESHPEWATDADVVAWSRAIRAAWERDPYRQVTPRG